MNIGYECSTCGKIFYREHGLRVHEGKHMSGHLDDNGRVVQNKRGVSKTEMLSIEIIGLINGAWDGSEERLRFVNKQLVEVFRKHYTVRKVKPLYKPENNQ